MYKRQALNRAGVKPEQVDEVMFGCILTAAQGQNVARQASIKAGIPYSVPAYTVGMVCGSGMKSVIEGARSILAGDSDIVVCGGTENMSAAPYTLPDEDVYKRQVRGGPPVRLFYEAGLNSVSAVFQNGSQSS